MTTETIEKYLLSEYQKRGNVDFFIHSNRLGKKLHLSTQTVGYSMRILRRTGSVVKYKKYVWKTNFSHKNDPTPEPVPVSKKYRWWQFKK